MCINTPKSRAFCYTIGMRKLLICFALALLFAACGYARTDVVLPNGFTVHTRIADTPKKTEKGLMFVKNLPEDEGMLFVFDKPDTHIFWMKNTLIDLDIIFLSPDGTINELYERVPHTYTYTPDAKVPIVRGNGQYVLEAAAGTISRAQLKSGDKLSFTLP